MDVRPLRAGEIPALHDGCWLPFAREMAELDDHDALADDEAELRDDNVAHKRERFVEDDSHTVVAIPDRDGLTADDTPSFAGYASAEIGESPPVFARGDPVYVSELYVRPEYRGDGLAHRLLDAVEDWGRDCGCERAELHVHARNETAKRVYETRGYEVFQYKLRTSL